MQWHIPTGRGKPAAAYHSPCTPVVSNKHVHASAGQHHLRYIGRRLRQASSNSSSGLQQKIQTTADDATQRVNDGPSGLTAATAAAAAAVPADDSAQRHIWVTIGGKRLDATAGGLEYEDGEEVGRSQPYGALYFRTVTVTRNSDASAPDLASPNSLFGCTEIVLRAIHHRWHGKHVRRADMCRQSAAPQQTGH